MGFTFRPESAMSPALGRAEPELSGDGVTGALDRWRDLSRIARGSEVRVRSGSPPKHGAQLNGIPLCLSLSLSPSLLSLVHFLYKEARARLRSLWRYTRCRRNIFSSLYTANSAHRPSASQDVFLRMVQFSLTIMFS